MSAGRLPDFVIAGAPRSGTSWLYELLDRHPQMHLAKPRRPEPKFFLIDALYAQGLDFYSRTWFADAPDECIAGEKSTNYLESAVAAERLGACLPRAKVVFILRDPVERAWSNWRWSRMNGLEPCDFATALELETQRGRELPEALRYARPFSYFSRGLYADLLAPWLRVVGRSRIIVLRFEDLLRRPGELAASLHRALGVSERPGDVEGLGSVNAAEGGDDAMPSDIRAALARRYALANVRLQDMLGVDFSDWGPR